MVSKYTRRKLHRHRRIRGGSGSGGNDSEFELVLDKNIHELLQ